MKLETLRNEPGHWDKVKRSTPCEHCGKSLPRGRLAFIMPMNGWTLCQLCKVGAAHNKVSPEAPVQA